MIAFEQILLQRLMLINAHHLLS